MRYLVNQYILFGCVLFLPLVSHPQSKLVLSTDDYSIRWMGKISDPEDVRLKKSFISRLFSVVTGKRNDSLVKPMSVIKTGQQQLTVLDQGARSIVNIEFAENQYRSINFSNCASLVDLTSLPNETLLFTDSNINHIFCRKKSDKKIFIFNNEHPLLQPTGIAWSAIDQLVYVSETAAHRLCVFDVNGNFIKTIGKQGTNPGEFNYPTFLTVDGQGFIYVVDSMNFRVQILSPDGKAAAHFGKPGDASGYFARPKGIACDSFGHIYVVDGLFHNIQIFDKEGQFLSQFGQQGHGPGEFWMPSGICIDKENKIYIADTYNARIQIFQLIVRNE